MVDRAVVARHRSSDSKRICRIKTFSRGDARAAFHFMCLQSHCFVRMPKKAAERLVMRLRKNRMLIHRTASEGAARRVEIVVLTVSLGTALLVPPDATP